jgi:hypothetical protein
VCGVTMCAGPLLGVQECFWVFAHGAETTTYCCNVGQQRAAIDSILSQKAVTMSHGCSNFDIGADHAVSPGVLLALRGPCHPVSPVCDTGWQLAGAPAPHCCRPVKALGQECNPLVVALVAGCVDATRCCCCAIHLGRTPSCQVAVSTCQHLQGSCRGGGFSAGQGTGQSGRSGLQAVTRNMP